MQHSAQLIERAQQGDHRAFGALMASHHRLVMATAYGYVGQWEDAEDVAQQVFIQAFLKLKYLREPERFGCWLRQITARVSIDALRRRRPALPLGELPEHLPDDSKTQSTLDRPGRQETAELLREALALLPEKTRLTVLLCYGAQYSHAEAARLLEVPLNTVRSRLQSAKRLLAGGMKMTQDKVREKTRQLDPVTPRREEVDLTEETAIAAHNDFLRAVANVLDLAVGEHLRAVYLVENYAWEGWLPVCYVFRNGQAAAHRRKVFSLVTHLTRLVKDRYVLDPIYADDESPFYDPGDYAKREGYPCTPIIRLAVRDHSLLLWGEDIRGKIALVTDEDAIRDDVLMPALDYIKQRHNVELDGVHPLDQPVTYPLADPTPPREYHGFGDLLAASTRVFHLARGLIYLQTGQYVFDQTQIAEAYGCHVGGPWGTLVQDMALIRYADLTASAQKKHWLTACKQMTAFENYFLERLTGRGIAY